MTFTCPNGHPSSTDDYCDECGAKIELATETIPAASVADPSAATGSSPAGSAPAESCPICGVANPPGNRFCEACGAPMDSPPVTAGGGSNGTGVGGWGAGAIESAASRVAPGEADPAASPVPSPPTTAVPVVTPGGPSGPAQPPGDGVATPSGEGAGAPVAPGASADGASADGASAPSTSDPQPGAPGRAAGTGPAWEAVAAADRAYYERMAPEGVPFPPHCPARTFALVGGEVRIGRRSASRGIHPEIDLSGRPEDTGISHLHALLVLQPDGSYSLIDPGSTNGTTVNDDPRPIEVNHPVSLWDGDEFHLGAWTTITLHARSTT